MSRRAPAAIRHRLEYGAFRLVSDTCNAVPERLADRAGASLGWLAARLGRPRWDVVTAQLAAAFPDASESWRREVARRCYAHLGAEAVAMFRLARLGPKEMRARTRVSGLELLERPLREGRGVMVVTGHLGNWEVGAAAVTARGLPVDVVAARQRNPLFDARLTRAREGLGLTVIPRDEARPRVLASLRAGRIVGILGDQDARRAGIFVDFFGRPAATARGPALLAVRAGAVLTTLFALRLPGSPPRYDVRIEEVDAPQVGVVDAPRVGAPAGEAAAPTRTATEVDPPPPRAAGLATHVAALTQAFTSRLEARVREHPEQYFWHHRRWKTAPPAAAPEEPSPDARELSAARRVY